MRLISPQIRPGLESFSNFVAGFGDGASGGISFYLRNWVGQLTETPDVVDRSSGFYSGGEITGTVASFALQVGEVVQTYRGIQATRGINELGGYFPAPIKNISGGEVYLSQGSIYQSDFTGIVNTALMKGNNVDIISGVHGFPDGRLLKSTDLLMEDVKLFGKISNVNIHDYYNLSSDQLSSIINNSSGTVVGAFCYSSICLSPLIK